MKGALWLLAMLSASVLAEDRLVSRHLGVTSRLGRRGLAASEVFNLTIVHVNDVHAHFDHFEKSGARCKPESTGCVAGYARLKTKMDDIRGSTERSLALNMGDEFQGTLFFSFFKGGYKVAEVVNSIGFDAVTIGNHEFDKGDNHLAEYLSNLTAPVISANIVTNNTKLAAQIKPYHIIPEYSMALIGLTSNDTPTTSSPDPGTKFSDPVTVLQDTVDYINEYENVKRIVAMTHIGYKEDIDLARRTRGIHLILGGHSHTLLGKDKDAKGDYPTIAKNLDGEEVFIVTAWRWGEVLGYINISFDGSERGRILEYSGGPIYMDNSTEPDPELQAKVDAWTKSFEPYLKAVIGTTEGELKDEICQLGECAFGNLVTDAIVDYRWKHSGAEVDGAIINAGGIRHPIDEGNITIGNILESFPFGSTIVDVEFTGEQLRTMFEGIVNGENSAHGKVTSFIQVSHSISMVYVPSEPHGKRLRSLSISGKPVESTKTYVISTIDFVARGGDGFIDPLWNLKTSAPMDNLETVVMEHVKKHTPLKPLLEGRIQKIAPFGTELYDGGDGRQVVVEDKSCFGASCFRES